MLYPPFMSLIAGRTGLYRFAIALRLTENLVGNFCGAI